ncbi:hypothetical protein WDU94_009786 [Cyamophila willieti]
MSTKTKIAMKLRIVKYKFLWFLCSFILGCAITLYYISKVDHISSAHTGLSKYKNLKHSYFLVILILTSSKNYIRRKNIRETWIKSIEKYQVKYLFSIGNKDHVLDLKLKEEIHQYDDILLLNQVPDEFTSLSQKVLHSMKYIYEHFDFQYLLKCDDDTFVRVPNIIHELEHKFHYDKKLYWGYFDGRARVKRLGKYKEINWFLCDRYLPYALGGGYVLSQSLVKFISQNSDMLSLYTCEDVSVGVWLSGLDITRYHDVRFDTEFQSRGCNNSYLIVHKQNMHQLYNSLMLSNQVRLCFQEYKDRNAYEYNWKVAPSQCCVRNNSKIP